MSLVLAILGWSAFAIAIIVGILLNLVGLFGNWIILAAVLAAGVLTGFEYFGWWTLFVLLLLAIAGEILEMLMAGVGAARYGGSRGAFAAALVGAIVGAIIGSPWIPIIGTVVGACIGAFAAAGLYELVRHGKRTDEALRVGVGAAAGKLGGIVAKSAVGFVMLGVTAVMFLT